MTLEPLLYIGQMSHMEDEVEEGQRLRDKALTLLTPDTPCTPHAEPHPEPHRVYPEPHPEPRRVFRVDRGVGSRTWKTRLRRGSGCGMMIRRSRGEALTLLTPEP